MLTWCRWRVLHNTGIWNHCRYYRQHGDSPDGLGSHFKKITVPQKLLENLQKQNVRKAMEKALKERPKLKNLRLSSKNKQYNFYKGQKFDEFNTKLLASHGWKHRKCGEDFFTLVPHGSNPSLASDRDTVSTFEEIGLDPAINKFLTDNNISKPTKIQSLVIPVMLKGQHVLCAAETGSGKTYAFLLPLLNMLLHHERTNENRGDTTNAPFGIIVAPSVELVNQITNVCKILSEYVPFHVVKRVNGRTDKEELKSRVEMDILVATPGTLELLLTSQKLSLSRLNTIVLDEADALVDDSFVDTTMTILERVQVGLGTSEDGNVAGGSVQAALVSATYPRNLDENIGSIVPINSFAKLATKQLHCLMPHVQQDFKRMRSRYKLEHIVWLLKEKKSKKYMVFCNKTDTCYWLSKTLAEVDIENVCVTSLLKPHERAVLLESFYKDQCDVLICTDIASRGLDTHMVDHVVNFDFPRFISSYIHRAGRVGRVGSSYEGQVTSFVVHSADIELTWKIEVAARKDKELHNVNANIKRVLRGRAERAAAERGEFVEEPKDEDEE